MGWDGYKQRNRAAADQLCGAISAAVGSVFCHGADHAVSVPTSEETLACIEMDDFVANFTARQQRLRSCLDSESIAG
jgi:hypothetical protein